MSRGAQLLHAIYGSFWAMSESKLHAMVAFLDEYASGVRFTAEEVRARVGEPRSRAKSPDGSGVGVLPLYGVVSHRAHLVQNISGPGGTSTELFGKDFDAMMEDPKIGTIVLDVDSPGGNVAGVQELAEKILAARGEKRIIAVANSLAASAAYWIASAADELVVTPSGEVGSIGVYAIHTDVSKREWDMGVKRTIIKAGRRKAEGHPYGPIDDEARAYAQSQIDEYYDAFTQGVARARGVSVDVARGEKFGEGRTVTARQAVARGLADRVATLEQVLGELGIDSSSKATPMRDKRRAESAAPTALKSATALVLAGAANDASLRELVEDAGLAAQIDVSDPRIIDAFLETLVGAVPRVLSTHSEARQGAAEPISSPLAPTAESAKEHPVPPTTTPAPGTPGAEEENAQTRAELDRQTRIRELCTLVDAPLAQMNEYISKGLSAEEVRADLQAKRAKPSPVANVQVGADRAAERPFTSIGEQLQAVRKAALTPHAVDPRLLAINAAATGAGETIGADGGFAIQNDLLALTMEPLFERSAILSRVRRVPIGVGKNGIKFWVIDEDSRATGSRFGGLQMQWVAEGDTATPKKPKLRKMELELKKLLGFAYVTEEELEDASGFGSIVEQAYQDESEFMLEDAVVNGIGGAMPLGINNAKCTQAIAIEGTQTIANSSQFIAKNAANMKAAVPPKIFQRGIWLANPEFEPTLITSTLGGTTNIPIYLPEGTIANAPYGTLLGRPVVFAEYCNAVGTPGDFMFAGLSEYVMADKAGVKTAWSSHVQFLTEQQCFRISLRVDGQPLWKDAVTPFKGAVKRTPFVTLATRS